MLRGRGVAVALIGSLMLSQTGKGRLPEAADGAASVEAQTKKCPDCAETILADAKVCKHCGYRFAPGVPDAPQELDPGKSTNAKLKPDSRVAHVRCPQCGTMQYISRSLPDFECLKCRATVKSPT